MELTLTMKTVIKLFYLTNILNNNTYNIIQHNIIQGYGCNIRIWLWRGYTYCTIASAVNIKYNLQCQHTRDCNDNVKEILDYHLGVAVIPRCLLTLSQREADHHWGVHHL